MKTQLLQELRSQNLLCFKHILETQHEIWITKSQARNSSTTLIRELVILQSMLEKYEPYFDISISLDAIHIVFTTEDNPN